MLIAFFFFYYFLCLFRSCAIFPLPKSLDVSHFAWAHHFTVFSKFRIKVPPNNCQSDWPEDHNASDWLLTK